MSTYLEKLRAAAQEKTKNQQSQNFGENEWTPGEISTRIRILPLPDKGDGSPSYPYVTHSFHYIEGGRDDGKDIKLWVPKKVNKDGAQVDDPIDVVVAKLYDTKQEGEKTIAGKIKRKRNFFFNALIYEEGKEPQLKTVIDSSADGKLARQVCQIMGIPFCKDTNDGWFPDQKNDYDPDGNYYDLVSTSDGFDFKVKKTITGKNPWDFNYSESFALSKGARPLNKAELELAKKAPDLDNYVKYETDFHKIEGYLNRFLSNVGLVDRPSKGKVNAAPVESDIDDDDLREALLKD
jgi:hypothetical protein